jgi:septal ring factor EnvC (AmiA/AmiB activator)
MKGYKYLFFSLILICNLGSLTGQSRQELEKQRMQIIKEIEKTTKALDATKKNKQKSLKDLKALEDKLNNRKLLIQNIQTQIDLNNKTVEQNKTTISALQANYAKLMTQYAKLVRVSYLKKRAQSPWVHLFSSKSLNNLLLRWTYVHQFANFAHQKAKEIKGTTREIATKNQEISKLTETNRFNMEQASKNMALLKQEQSEKDKTIQKLSAEERNLDAKLKKRERERENLNASIERIIIAELNKSSAREKDDISLVKKREIDNTDFSKNRGSLPWPVSKGKITGKFGTHPHPTLKNIEIANNGIDITMPGPGDVNAIFEGEVSGVTSIPGWDNVVMVKHGNYTTIYAKLKSVHVSKGQKVRRGQSLGAVSTNDEGAVELHFELWKDKTKLNPQNWLGR